MLRGPWRSTSGLGQAQTQFLALVCGAWSNECLSPVQRSAKQGKHYTQTGHGQCNRFGKLDQRRAGKHQQAAGAKTENSDELAIVVLSLGAHPGIDLR